MFTNKLFITVLAITSLLEATTKGKMGFAEVKNWSGGGGGGGVVLNIACDVGTTTRLKKFPKMTPCFWPFLYFLMQTC